ncbi:AraC family transcriptional regulator [Rhodococcus pyridinivorans]|uniref:helix-turn-helix transcriptional regulator n=1 Tax=Rhodococcus pyridinivorans TaxID=103816 RepID=UPI00200B6501|nr:AraC family transcriptional regulator [Rhodococcus pyridinivorans]UPW02916.1 AraC family transcriptional regulator [Rhodococcus pyridinivorans]
MKLVFARAGSALVLSEFGERHLNVGDVAVIAANTLCGAEPEEWVTTTTLYLDPDYVVDQVFWQHAAFLADRLHAQDFVDELYSEPAQLLHLGEDRAGLLMPWLDELVALSVDGPVPERFYRMQALLFAVLDVVVPFIRTSSARRSPTQRRSTRPGLPRHRRFVPLRTEAHQVAELLRSSPELPWTLSRLAEHVHLSPKQLSRVFTDAYGKTPLAYLTMLRVETMARLLRETNTSIASAGRAVGWASRSRASEAFRQCVGVTPQRYRDRLRRAANA